MDLLATTGRLAIVAMTMFLAIGSAAAAPKGEPSTPSEWLRESQARLSEGHLVEAAEAFTEVYRSLSERKRRANEGARAVLLAAETYWDAFETTDKPLAASLQPALAVLEDWLEEAALAPKPASLRPDVEQLLNITQATHRALAEAEAAEDPHTANAAYATALETLEAAERSWDLLGRVTLQQATLLLSSYDEQATAPDVLADEAWKLDAIETSIAARLALEGADQGDAAVRERMNERLGQVAERRAAAARAQDEAAARRRAENVQTSSAQPEPTNEATRAQQRKRVASIVVVSIGATATAAGIGMAIGGGLAQRRTDDDEAQLRMDANALAESNPLFDQAGFEQALDDYVDEARRRNIGLIAGGSVLMAAGLATTITGIVLLARNRRAPSTRAHLEPRWSPTGAHLVLTTRF